VASGIAVHNDAPVRNQAEEHNVHAGAEDVGEESEASESEASEESLLEEESDSGEEENFGTPQSVSSATTSGSEVGASPENQAAQERPVATVEQPDVAETHEPVESLETPRRSGRQRKEPSRFGDQYAAFYGSRK